MENEQILEQFKSFDEDSNFISKNFTELQKKFGDKFIVVTKSSVLANAESFDKILKKIKEKKLDKGEIVVQFIPREGQIILY